jgi:hypothetical protein
MIMSNPYTVSLSLSGFDTLLYLEDKNTVRLAVAKHGDTTWQCVFELAKKIWIKEFHMSDKDLNNARLSESTIVVMYNNDNKGNSNPVSAARFEIYEEPQTHIKTAKIYSMASLVKKKGYGKLLLLEISKFVTNKCGCKFMTVDVVRPSISDQNSIAMLMQDQTENENWNLEKDRVPRRYGVGHRSINSDERTKRVEGLLLFYKKCNFVFQITPCGRPGTYLTPWGDILPFYCYTLVARLGDASVIDNTERLSQWQEFKDLQENYNSYTHPS